MILDRLLLALAGDEAASAPGGWNSWIMSREVMILLLFVAAIGAIWTVILLWDRFRKSANVTETATRSLFNDLCHVHQLERRDIDLLAAAAREYRLDSPALLFACPDRFDVICADSRPNSEAYRELRDRLFGKLA